MTDANKRPSSVITPVTVGSYRCGGGEPLLLIAGPCVLQSLELSLEIAELLARLNEHDPRRLQIKVDADSGDYRARPVELRHPYHFKIERNDGRTVRWLVDDIELFGFLDPEPLEGAGHEHFAFNNWQVPVCFDNLTITPYWAGIGRMTCNVCHTAITHLYHDRKLCQPCYDHWELKRVQGGKRARKVWMRKMRLRREKRQK